MSVVVKRDAKNGHRVYHKQGCIHIQKIKKGTLLKVTVLQAERKGYRECKCCGGIKGEARIQQQKYAAKKDITFTYSKQKNEFYIATGIGFWKVCVQRRSGAYLLYHRNRYLSGMDVKEAIRGEFHRQSDVAGNKSLDSLVEYIIAHDRAKVTIMEDYKKLPQRTKKERHYYKVAEKRNRKNAIRRVDNLFAMLERADAGMKQYSIC